jgi:hypothetical protein
MLSNSVSGTHVVVSRRSPNSEKSDIGQIGVENRVAETAMNHGSAVHVAIQESALREMIGEEFREHFERVDRDGGRLTGETEFRAVLPDGRGAVLALLSVDQADTDEWTRRLFALEEFVVVTPDSWLYRSIPHHDHIREINAGATGELLSDIRDTLAGSPQTGVFPDRPLATWQTREKTWELWPEYLRQRSGESSWHAYDLEQIVAFHPVPRRDELLIQWGSPTSLPGRLGSAIRRALQGSPPERVHVSGEASLDEVVSALDELAVTLGYEYHIG